jgi:hypothetical protein
MEDNDDANGTVPDSQPPRGGLILENSPVRVSGSLGSTCYPLCSTPQIEIKLIWNKNVNSASRSASSQLAMVVEVGSTGKHNSNKQTHLLDSSSKPKLIKILPLRHSQL